MGMNNRFRGDTQVLKSFITEGQLGEIYYAKCGWTRRNGIPGLGGWFTTKALSGGGPLIDIGVHVLDLTTYLMGNPAPVSASGFHLRPLRPARARRRGLRPSRPIRGPRSQYDVEDLAAGLVKFDNGATLFLEASWASYTAQATNSTPRCSAPRAARTWSRCGSTRTWRAAPVDIAPHAPQVGGHEAEIKHFIECIAQNKPPISTAEQGLHILQILDAVYRSAETGT